MRDGAVLDRQANIRSKMDDLYFEMKLIEDLQSEVVTKAQKLKEVEVLCAEQKEEIAKLARNNAFLELQNKEQRCDNCKGIKNT